MSKTTITPSMRMATASAIERIARVTAEQATGQRRQDAIQHLKAIEARKRSTPDIEAEIERLQGVQKRNASTTNEWKLASQLLKPLFAEMARRQQAGQL